MEKRKTRRLARKEEESNPPLQLETSPNEVSPAPAAEIAAEALRVEKLQTHVDDTPLPSSDDVVKETEEEQPPILVEDEDDEDHDSARGISEEDAIEGEDDIRKAQKLDFVATISSLRLTPREHSRLRIPLCRLVPMPMVRPTLACDLIKLEQEFVHGYEDGARVFYVSIADEQGLTGYFTHAEKEEWGEHWNFVNDDFNSKLTANLKHLVDAKFFVCDGNHRTIAWMRHIRRLHSGELSWHISVDSIILDTRGRVGAAMQVMHDINKHTENSHVKTNLVHTLYRVRKYGSLPIEKFNELLTTEDIKVCQQNTRKTWYCMPLEVFTSFIFQQEIAAASDAAVRKYHEDTAATDVNDAGITAAMRSATKDATDKLYKKLSKIVSVASPALGDEWLQEIERHWSLYALPELTLEKLQMIATTNTDVVHKVKWLKWINSSTPSRKARRFPPRPVNEDKLNSFLSKACWYAGMEDAVLEMYEAIIRGDNIPVNMEVVGEPESLPDYIEGWRMKLWDHAFPGVFKGADAFKKSDSFKDSKGAALVVKRVIYRYFKLELYPKKAIGKADLPPFLNSWLDRSSSDCMFSPSQVKNNPSGHLQSAAWYLDCSQGYVPAQELALFQSIKETVVVEPEIDEFAGLEGDARAKAIKRREVSDKKKEDKLESARLKNEENDAKKKAKQAEKGKAKSDAKGGRKRKMETTEPAASDVATKDNSSGFSLNQDVLHHGPPATAHFMQSVANVDECILNESVTSLLPNEEGPTPQAMKDVIALLQKHVCDKDRYVNGVVTKTVAIDLLIFDVPEGLPVPTVSTPSDVVPEWNKFSLDGLEAVFEFADAYLHDSGALLVMYPFSRDIKSHILTFCNTYGFKSQKDWWVMNRLHLTLPTDTSSTTMRFALSLYVKTGTGRSRSRFSFQAVPSHEAVGVNVALDDSLQNFCGKDDVAMNGKMPWRGPREKALAFLQMLIEATTLPGDVVMDCTASTGSSILVCRATRRHIVALEEDSSVFEALIKPLLSEATVSKPQENVTVDPMMMDFDNEDVPVRRIEKKSRFSKQNERMKMPAHRPFFAHPTFLCSPPKSFQLPPYAEAMARDFWTHDPKPSSMSCRVDPRVLKFVDDSAMDSDSESTSSVESSMSKSSTSSYCS